MYIISNNILIRNAKKSDASLLYRWWSDGKVMEHAGFPNGLVTSVEEIENDIENYDNSSRTLIIEYNLFAIGELNYRRINKEIVEIGIKICNDNFQNKGLGREILSLFIKELFHMNYKKIVLDTNLNNLRAQHVYELLGFKKLRVIYNSWENQLGELQSAVDYGLTEENFIDYSENSNRGFSI